MSNQSSVIAKAPQPPAGYPSNYRNYLSPRLFATGGNAATNAADFTNSTPVITELYVAELAILGPTTTTGVAVFAGSVWSDSLKVGLFDANGVLLLSSATTAGNTTADAYQTFTWALDFRYNASGATFSGAAELSPGTYYIGVILNGTTSRLNTNTVGAFGAGKITGLTYSTALVSAALTITPPTTFTTALGPVASLI